MLFSDATMLAARAAKFAVLGALVLASACSGGGSSGTSPVPNTWFCCADTDCVSRLMEKKAPRRASDGVPVARETASASRAP